MDKKTKLWLGVGVVGVGAYLLWKSKQTATPMAAATTTATTAKEFLAGDRQISQDGTQFFGHQRMMNQTGIINSLDTPRTKFNQTGATLNGNSLDVKGGHAGVKGQGIFANKPFTAEPKNIVGANGVSGFASQDGTGKFFQPRTAKYGTNQGVFAPSATAPMNNLVGQDGSRFFAVHDGFGK